jgi:RHS repeat-associated protein
VQEASTGTTTYTYDNVGNLQSVTYPNGVVHTYGYDGRNRLTNLGVSGMASGTPGPIASYAYTLDDSGHRTGVTELNGRTVSYDYDNLYRLTSETIASDPAGINGTASYVYDPVGNRTQKVSSIPGYPGGLLNYNANDELTTDAYDANGNTTGSGANTGSNGYVYDFENHLIQQGGMRFTYDGDGNRVSKTTPSGTVRYLVDTQNPTGYAQVIQEQFSSNNSGAQELSHSYVYGLERISENRQYFTGTQSLSQTFYFDYDGHGWVRALTDPTGMVTDTYDYDAFGNLIHSTGTTPNNYLFAGEQFDPDLNLYYNRARYLKTSTGRFWSADAFEGTPEDPGSQHRYLYSFGNPVDYVDPSGRSGNSIFNIWGNLVQKKIFADYGDWSRLNGHEGYTNKSIRTILRLPPAPRGDDIYSRPDIADVTDEMIYEIKPAVAAAAAQADIAYYMALILENGGGAWTPGTNFTDAQEIPLFGGLYVAVVEPTVNGMILYTVKSNSPLTIPIIPVPLSPDTISEETLKQEARVAAAAEEAELEEVKETSTVLSVF